MSRLSRSGKLLLCLDAPSLGLDQPVRKEQFVLRDGTVARPLWTPGGYLRFTLAVLEDIALSSYRHGWFSMDTLKFIYRKLLMVVHRDTGDYEIPS